MAEHRAGFADRLVARSRATSPLCVGIDPSSALLASWDLPDEPESLATFGVTDVKAVSASASAIKPQVAFFERHGAAGYAALQSVIEAATAEGLLVIADAKRGDIDSTMEAYGEAWLSDSSPLAVDALTVTAYLGIGAMGDVIERATRSGRGLFVVVASSNPEGRTLQEARVAPGERVEEHLLSELGRRNREEIRSLDRALGSLGAVIGATRSPGSLALPSLEGPLLVPGLGAQGATPHDVAMMTAGCVDGAVLASASRSILAAGPDHGSLARAAETLAEELRHALG